MGSITYQTKALKQSFFEFVSSLKVFFINSRGFFQAKIANLREIVGRSRIPGNFTWKNDGKDEQN